MHRSRPVSRRIVRTKFAFVSSVVYPAPPSSSVCTAHPVAESISVSANPPCTMPSGLRTNSDASPSKTARPSATSASTNPNVAAIGGGGSRPSIIAFRNAIPLVSPESSNETGSDHVYVRVRSPTLAESGGAVGDGPELLVGHAVRDERRVQALRDRLLRDHALGDVASRRQLEHHVEQRALDDRPESAGACLALERAVGDLPERVVREHELDRVVAEETLVLADEGVLRLGED